MTLTLNDSLLPECEALLQTLREALKDALPAEQSASLEFLSLCAVLAPCAIPLSLFGKEINGQGGSSLSTMQATDQIIEMLSAKGLITLQDGMLNLSPMIQECLYDTLPLDQRRSLVEQALSLLEQQLPLLEMGGSPESLLYLSHIQQIHARTQEWTFTFGEVATVFAWAAGILLQQEHYSEAEFLLRRALLIWERVLGVRNSLVNKTVYNLAILTEKQGNYAEAETLLQRAILAAAHTLRADHPETLHMLVRLAQIYVHQDKLLEAELTYRKALALCTDGIGFEHPLTISVQYGLANLYIEKHEEFQANKAAEAESLLQKVHVFYENKLGGEHPETVRVLHKLALIFLDQQKWEQAEVGLQKVCIAYERQKKTEQPEMVEILYQLAFARAIQQKWDTQTDELLQRIGISTTKILGPDHANTLEIYSNLAVVYMARQSWDLATPLLQSLSVSYERTLGPEHLATGQVLHSLAEVNLVQNHWKQAEVLYERTLAIYTKAADQVYLETLNCLQQMVALYQQQENFSRVTVLQQHIQNIWEKLAQETDTPDALIGLNGLSGQCIEQARFAEAESLLRRALAICQRHPEVGLIVLVLVLQNLAKAYSGQGKLEQARVIFQRATAIQEGIVELSQGLLSLPG